MMKDWSTFKVALFVFLGLSVAVLPIGTFWLGTYFGPFLALDSGIVSNPSAVELELDGQKIVVPKNAVFHEIDVPGQEHYYALIFKASTRVAKPIQYDRDDIIASYSVLNEGE